MARLIGMVVVLLGALVTAPLAGVASSLPAGIELQHGDLIWARNKHLSTPYKMPEMKALIGTPKKAEDWSGVARLSAPKTLDKKTLGSKYEQFYETMGWTVGHVAIVSRLGNTITVIEAANEEEGVTSTPLKEWLASWTTDDVFWIGRLVGFDKAEIASFVNVAQMQVSLKKPYDITNRNLVDDTSFYCSKLVWYALMKALNTAADGNPNPDRWLPYSPKQLIRSPLFRLFYGDAQDY